MAELDELDRLRAETKALKLQLGNNERQKQQTELTERAILEEDIDVSLAQAANVSINKSANDGKSYFSRLVKSVKGTVQTTMKSLSGLGKKTPSKQKKQNEKKEAVQRNRERVARPTSMPIPIPPPAPVPGLCYNHNVCVNPPDLASYSLQPKQSRLSTLEKQELAKQLKERIELQKFFEEKANIDHTDGWSAADHEYGYYKHLARFDGYYGFDGNNMSLLATPEQTSPEELAKLAKQSQDDEAMLWYMFKNAEDAACAPHYWQCDQDAFDNDERACVHYANQSEQDIRSIGFVDDGFGDDAGYFCATFKGASLWNPQDDPGLALPQNVFAGTGPGDEPASE